MQHVASKFTLSDWVILKLEKKYRHSNSENTRIENSKYKYNLKGESEWTKYINIFYKLKWISRNEKISEIKIIADELITRL